MKFYKTRIAPTPSGYLHIGNAFSFLITQALAQQTGAAILLRIDDMDRQRYRQDYVNDIFETLSFLNIRWQQGPADVFDFEAAWSQTHRTRLYDAALQRLREKNCVFACACSRTNHTSGQLCGCLAKNILLDAAGAAWRLKTALNDAVTVNNLRGDEVTTMLPASMQQFVVRRKDGVPAYQLTSLIDDLHFGIDLIVRGQDLWDSTVAQQVLARRLGEERFSQSLFYHHPLLRDESGRKFSKSAGASSIREWRSAGKSFAQLIEQIGKMLYCPAPVRNAQDLLKCLNR